MQNCKQQESKRVKKSGEYVCTSYATAHLSIVNMSSVVDHSCYRVRIDQVLVLVFKDDLFTMCRTLNFHQADSAFYSIFIRVVNNRYVLCFYIARWCEVRHVQ